jgi:hypothetical protein
VAVLPGGAGACSETVHLPNFKSVSAPSSCVPRLLWDETWVVGFRLGDRDSAAVYDYGVGAVLLPSVHLSVCHADPVVL